MTFSMKHSYRNDECETDDDLRDQAGFDQRATDFLIRWGKRRVGESCSPVHREGFDDGV